MQIPILTGVYTDNSSDIRTSYPRNLIPVPIETALSAGYLRPADGTISQGEGPGVDRGAINWNNECYRVMGTQLIKIESDGNYQDIGSVGGAGQVTLDYSFDYLAIASGGNFFLYNGIDPIQQVIDPNLGTVVDFTWVDGYFMTTDGEFLIVTNLNDPFTVDPLKYGSSESDPDPVLGLLSLRNEVYVYNRYTTEIFNNIGGDNFPFGRVPGAQLEKGAIGTHTACIFDGTFAFMGSGRNESPSIYIGGGGQLVRIATREIELILLEYTEEELSSAVFEERLYEGHRQLFIHLADQTLVYDKGSSQILGTPVWFTLDSGTSGKQKLKWRNIVWCYNKWLIGDPTSFSYGYLTNDVGSHFDQTISWDFSTGIVYNEGKGALFNSLELVALTGRNEGDAIQTMWTQYSTDGQSWSEEKFINTGASGDRDKRLVWFEQGNMRNWRIQRFGGDSNTRLSFMRLEAEMEALYD